MIESMTVHARYVSGRSLSQAEQAEWLASIKFDEANLNTALQQGYSILQSWPSADGNMLNILLHKEGPNK